MENSTLVAFANDDAPQNLVIAMTTSATTSFVLFLANAYYLVRVVLVYIRTERAKHLEVLRLLIGQITFTGLTCAWGSSLVAIKKSVQACNYLASAGAFVYCMSFVFGYLILLNRAKAVNEWEQTKCFNALHWTVSMAVYGMGVFSIAACFLLYGKTFFKEHYCAQVPLHPVVIWIMLVMDSLLSFTLFYLFAGPMIARLKMRRNKANELEDHDDVGGETSVLKKTAWRNFVISSIQIFSTFAVLLIVLTCNEVVTYSVDPELQLLNLVTAFTGPIDTSINAACSLAMVQKVWRGKAITQVVPRSRTSKVSRRNSDGFKTASL